MHAPDSITYVYECNRLKEIHYPGHPENDVTYVYGTKTDTGVTNGFRAGRLKYLIDGSGAREYTYGRMGEVTQERRTLIIPNQAVATYVTGWTYDAWNRVRTMTYPDGEQLTYQYNPGGLLRAINGVKDNEQYAYILDINYDKFERRTSIRYGNNVVTEYTYNDLSFNLSNLKVVSTYNGNRCLMDNAYTYDAVDNVTKVTNTAPIPSTGIGGNITHNYAYDGLYRLQTANGFYQGNAGKIAAYNLVMTYDNLHNITGKKLDMGQCNLQFTGELETGYDLTYAYNPSNDQQLAQVADTGYRWLGNPTPLTGQLAFQPAYHCQGRRGCGELHRAVFLAPVIIEKAPYIQGDTAHPRLFEGLWYRSNTYF